MKVALRTILAILLVFLSLTAYGYDSGDTGTYKILDYRVALTPHTDGIITIEYYQKWLVMDGHIPWITVGVPNEDYGIKSFGLAVSNAYSDNSGENNLIHLDLNKDYQSNDTFEIKFAIDEKRLYSEVGNCYRLGFTPGWYDRAYTEHLKIWVKTLSNASNISANPSPSSQTDNSFTWEATELRPGQQYSVYVDMPKSLFTGSVLTVSASNDHPGMRTDHIIGLFCLGCVIIFTFIMVVGGKIADKHSKGKYTGGNFHGGSFHGGGFSCACACACACAGCACACACAGGGGAGCSRKRQHSCPHCNSANR